MKKKLLGFGLLIVIIVISVIGYQQVQPKGGSQTKSSDKPVLKVATTGVSFPGSYKDDDELTGFDVEVARAVAKKIGYDISFTTTSFDGLFGLLTSGKVDAIASSIAITDERKELYDFSRPYAPFEYGVVVRKDSDWTNIDQLSHKKLAATVGSNQIKVVNKFDPTIGIQTYDDREAALSGDINSQVDGYSNAKTILSAIIEQRHLDLKILDGSLGEENIAITVNNRGLLPL